MLSNLIKYGREKSEEVRVFNELAYLSYKFNIALPVNVNMKHGTVETNDGIKFYLAAIDPFIYLETFGLRIHDALEVKKGATIIDAGASFGDTALYYANKGLKVIAVELNPITYRAMEMNIELNPKIKGGIKTYNCAIGPAGTVSASFNSATYDGNASIERRQKNHDKSIQVQSRTLASFGKVDYLKMDIKGAERHLTVDDLKYIKKGLKIEYTCTESMEFEELKSKITKAGFKITKIYSSNPEVKENEKWGTILAYK